MILRLDNLYKIKYGYFGISASFNPCTFIENALGKSEISVLDKPTHLKNPPPD
jgi:hypothetical protein